MFTERYMVEWLLQNSLGLTWLCMCKKRGWTPDAERVLPVLEARRVEWRARREAGEVALDALMPIEGDLEDDWKYFVPQPIPEDAVEKAPDSVRALKILDPACGSGHFLVIAFGLLSMIYREEAQHRGETITPREIAESILENNLFGIDIDSRAIQIAAAALYLKAKSLAKDARPKTLNLVAPALQLGNLAHDDPAVVHLRQDLKREVGIPEELTTKLLTALAGVDYLGSLLKVNTEVESALHSVELEFERSQGQGDLFRGFPARQAKLPIVDAKATFLGKLELFMARHSKSGDLGLRLDGEQLAAGVRFVRIAKEDIYDIVVGNPPYQRLSKTRSFGYVESTYRGGKADLYTAFLERGLELARPGGMSALLTMRGWMFLGDGKLRKHLLHQHDLRAVGDFDRGAFDEVPNELLAVAVSILRRGGHSNLASVALLPTPLSDRSYDRNRTDRKRAAVLAGVGRYDFDPQRFEVIEGEPIVYWWSREFLEEYAKAPKIGEVSPARQGMATGDNTRFLRRPWELVLEDIAVCRASSLQPETSSFERQWVPYIKGGEGRVWIEALREVLRWEPWLLQVRLYPGSYLKNERFFFCSGIAFTPIGSAFSARAHRYLSVFDVMGQSVFPLEVDSIVCLMNSSRARFVLESLNPTVHFQVGDVNRLPILHMPFSAQILDTLEGAFAVHEAGRETSIEFRRPGPSPWQDAQNWAQQAVDGPEGVSLPLYEPVQVLPDPANMVSFCIGVALGRFGADGEGILDKAPFAALQHGILFIAPDASDSLQHPACEPLQDWWKDHGGAVGGGDDLRTYLRKSFFGFHKKLYENRPIYFPFSSAKKSFVAFVSIHRWKDDTLNVLLADHFVPAKRRLESELEDLRIARASGTNKGKAERRYSEVQKLLEELNDFIATVTEIAEKGPPPPDDKIPKREVDTRYAMDLDDGVMVNSAALWPLLEPQWKDPKKWWRELATAQGKKDYDWSTLAARYFPKRVQEKCHKDPSLAVAHKCFWELHPAKAYAWELRLQDEIRSDFTIDEPGSNSARAKFLAENASEAAEILATEMRRRERKAAKSEDESGAGPLFDENDEEAEELVDD